MVPKIHRVTNQNRFCPITLRLRDAQRRVVEVRMRSGLGFGILIGFVAAIIALAGGCYSYLASGAAPAAVSDPMMPFERNLANMALNAHIEKQHVGPAPVPADEANLLAGADVYKKDCATCH